MGLSSRSGRAVTALDSLVAFAVCDRCGKWDNHDKLCWQYAWAGNDTVNLRLLVCSECLDDLQDQQRSIVLPPDPVPTRDPRLENFEQDANGGNLSGVNPASAVSPGSNPGIEWDQPGQDYDTPAGQQWDLTVPD